MFAAKNELFTTPSGYQIQRSLRFRSSATASLTRTPASATNRKTWTWSGWVKRGALSSSQALFSCESAASNYSVLYFSSANILQFYSNSGGTDYSEETVAVFRDPSSWYHIVFALDTTQATASNRAKIYINGVQQTTGQAFGQIPQNNEPFINSLNQHAIGRDEDGNVNYFDGYATEVNFIDGQALTPSSFGAINAVTGVWSATKYAGTYGTNGFYLNFTDNSAATAATIGKDYSGNGNNWTPNNISVTAGATYDSMLDAPLGAGGGERGNYCVMNSLTQRWSQPNTAYADGNLKVSTTSANSAYSLGTISQSTGKYYWEVTVVAVGATAIGIGVGDSLVQNTTLTNTVQYLSSGSKTVGGSSTAYGASFTTSDVIGVALDLAGSSVTFYKNNTSQGSIGLPSTTDITAFQDINTPANLAVNFGQRPFSYTPPTGFKALHTGNLAAPVIALPAQYMAATLYTGTGASLTVANTVNSTSFQPDWVWVKGRSGATDHALYDSVRGVQKQIESNSTGAETTETTGLTAFGSTGFTVGALAQMNTSAATYVAWQWKAGGTAVSNTSGSITSSVSANTTAGFSVVTYTGNGTSGATFGHGLGATPSMVLVKIRNAAANWVVYHSRLNGGVTPQNYYLYLSTTNAEAAYAQHWNNTAPTSSLITLGNDGSVNGSSNTFVAYCFTPVAGYSAFGSYTGNGSADGPFVYLGFRPKFIMFKESSGTGAATSNWIIMDSSRGTYNAVDMGLSPNLSNAEFSSYPVDFLSNGYKIRTTNQSWNESGGTFIYAAFAESPFKNSLAR